MSKVNEFTQNEWDHLHDVVLDATWKTTKTKLTQQELENLFQELPEYIKDDAYRWGLNDTVVRDNIHVWYQKNKM
jgi:hypothetical protein